ncbi:uncharacterized protein AMSG_06822 [Thecamonas trahens ATCC 50062]|uniref:Kinesin motor domain-containing protein n=1 Tax=Thecamonas trahens ATCC 50062 TaxID=461836 RepID=A0A0L0DG62_THETB|nr:hypothetical protein AMSG_06822 [Thecamonas trahens ATCC 50062]KNC50338.1 hypothetical protein AMSG_06822 [Thecamonas trahens ATCC 50062]|eukprot:XP_013756884.1 hypothetical protein AMSG_06822 [Thecamonas trahens ATCC 50062]
MESRSREPDAVHVALRVVSPSGARGGSARVLSVNRHPPCVSYTPGGGAGSSATVFGADAVYSEADSNKAVYASSVRPLVAAALQGASGLLAVHGRTGTGRLALLCGTGDGGDRSIILRALQDIFYFLRKRASVEAAASPAPTGMDSVGFALHASLLQVGPGEELVDVLRPASGSLRLVEAPAGDAMEVEGLSLRPLANPGDIEPLLARLARRTKGESVEHRKASSVVLILTIAQSQTSRAQRTRFVTTSKLGFVLLPSAEVATAQVNRSLNALRAVLTLLRCHARESPDATLLVRSIPYAYAKLTTALKDMLSPASHVVLIATASDDDNQLDASLATLLYASRVAAPLYGSDPDIGELLGGYGMPHGAPGFGSPAQRQHPAAGDSVDGQLGFAASGAGASFTSEPSMAAALDAATVDNATLTKLLAASQDKLAAAVDESQHAQAEAKDATERLRVESERAAAAAKAHTTATKQLAKCRNELNSARATAKSASASAAQAEADRDELTALNDVLHKQLGDTISQLEEASAVNGRLDERNATLEAEVSRLRAALNKACDELEASQHREITLSQQLADAQREAASNHDALTSALAELDMLSAQHNQAVARLDEVKHHAQSTAAETANLRSRLEASALATSMASQYRDRAATAEELREELMRVQAKLTRTVNYARNIEDEKDKAEHVIMQMQAQLDQAERKLQRVAIRVEAEVEDQIQGMRKKLTDANAEIERLHRKVREEEERAHRAQTLQATDPILDRQMSQLKMELQAETTRREQVESELRDARKALQELKTQHEIVSHDLESMSRKLDHRQDALSAAVSDKKTMAQELDSTAKALAQASRERDATAAELMAASARIASLTSEVEAAGEKLADRDESVRRLEAQLTKATDASLASEKKVLHLGMQVEHSAATVQRLKDDLAAAKATAADAQTATHQVTKTRDELAVQLSSLTAQLAAADEQSKRDAAAIDDAAVKLAAALAAHDETKTEIRELRHDLDAAQKTGASLARELAAAQTTAEKAEAARKAAVVAAAAASDEARGLKSELATTESQLGKLAAQLDAVRDASRDAKELHTALAAELKDKTAELDAAKSKLMQLENKVVLADDKVAHAHESIADLKAALASSEARSDSLAASKDDALSKLRTREAELAEARRANDVLSRDSEAVIAARRELEETLRSVRDELGEARAEASRSAGRVTHLEQDLTHANSRIESLRTVEEKAARLDGEVAQQKAELQLAAGRIESSSRAASEWEGKAEALVRELAVARDEVRDVKFELRECQTAREKTHAELDAALRASSQLEHKLSAATDKVANLEQALREARAHGESMRTSLERKNAETGASLDASRAENARLETALAGQNAAVRECQAKIETLNEALQAAKMQHVDVAAQASAAQAKVDGLRNELDAARGAARDAQSAAKAKLAASVRAADEAAAAAASKLAARESELDSLAKARSEMQHQLSKLRLELDAARQDAVREAAAVSAAESRIRSLQDEVAQANERVAQARDEAASMVMAHKEAQFAADQKAARELGAVQVELATTKAALQSLTEACNAARAEAQRVPDLERQVAALTNQVSALRQAEARAQAAVMQAESKAATSESLAASLAPLKDAVADGLATNAQLHAKIADLNETIQELRSGAASSAIEVESKQSQLESLDEKLSQALAHLESERGTVAALRDELDRTRREVDALRSESTSREREVRELASKAAAAEQQAAFARESLAALEKDKSEAVAQAREATIARETAMREAATLAAQQARHEAEAALMKVSSDNAADKQASCAAELERVREEARRATDRVTGLETTNASLQALVKQLEASLGEAKAGSESVRTELVQMKAALDEAHGRELAAKEAAASLKLEMATQGAQAQLAMYESQARAESSKAKSAEALSMQLAAAEERARALNSELQRKSDEGAYAVSQSENLTTQVQSLRARVTEAERQVLEANAATRGAAVKAERLEQELAVKEAMVVQLSAELDGAQSLHARAARLEENVGSLSALLAEAEARIETERSRAARLGESEAQSVTRVAALTREVAQVRERADRAEAELALAKRTIDDLDSSKRQLAVQLSEASITSTRLDASVSEARTRTMQIERTSRDATTRAQAAEQQLERVRAQLVAAEARAEAAEREAADLRREMVRATSQEQQLAATSDEARRLQTRVRELEAQLVQAEAAAASARSDLATQRRESDELRRQVDRLESEVARIQDRASHLQMTLLERESELAASVLATRQMEDELHMERMQHSRIRDQIELAVSQIDLKRDI